MGAYISRPKLIQKLLKTKEITDIANLDIEGHVKTIKI